MKISRLITFGVLALTLIGVLLAVRTPNVSLVPATADDVKSFDEKIAFLMQAHGQGATQTAHITAGELTSKLQQGLDGIPPSSGGSLVLRGASIQLQSNHFVGVFTLDASGKELYLTMTGTLGVLDGRVEIQPISAALGSLPLPALVVRRILQRQFDTPENRDRLRLPEFIKDVRLQNGELLVEAQ